MSYRGASLSFTIISLRFGVTIQLHRKTTAQEFHKIETTLTTMK